MTPLRAEFLLLLPVCFWGLLVKLSTFLEEKTNLYRPKYIEIFFIISSILFSSQFFFFPTWKFNRMLEDTLHYCEWLFPESDNCCLIAVDYSSWACWQVEKGLRFSSEYTAVSLSLVECNSTLIVLDLKKGLKYMDACMPARWGDSLSVQLQGNHSPCWVKAFQMLLSRREAPIPCK